MMIGFVILNYLTYAETINCVNSIQNTCKTRYRIVIIDNASPNESYQLLSDKYHDAEDVEVYNHAVNNGYSAGNNYGIRIIENTCENIIICNSDVLFCDEAINELIAPLEKRIADAVAPKVLKEDGTEWLSNQFVPIGKRELVLGYSFLKRLDLHQTYKKVSGLSADRRNLCQIYAPSGCCFAVRTSAFRAIGYFDENTFLGYEEAIFGFRMKQKGFRCVYNPKAEVYHLHMASTKQIGAKSLVACTTSEMYYLKEYLKSGNIFALFLFGIRVIEFLRLAIVNPDNKKWLRSYLSILKKVIQNDLAQEIEKE